MRFVIPCIIMVVCTVMCYSPLMALEGGYTSSHGDWKGVSHAKPDAATRSKEKQDRSAAIQSEIARLKERLQRQPSAEQMKKLHGALEQVQKNYGWDPKSQLVFGHRSVEPMLKKQNTMRKSLLAAFKQLNEDFKARDIDLIVMPMVPNPFFAAHLMVDGIEAEHEYYPGWTEMMIEMLENDIEIVDSVDEYRKEASNKVLVSWVEDFHTASLGRQLAAKKVAERLQRYDFARDLAGNRSKWKTSVKTMKGPHFPGRILGVNKATMSGSEYWKSQGSKEPRYVLKRKPLPKDKGLYILKGKKGESVLRPDFPMDAIDTIKNRSFDIMNMSGPKADKSLMRTELVLIGDSQCHSAVYGAGLPSFFNAAVGGIFRWGSKSWSGFSPPEIYLETVSNADVQPRVVVLALLPKYFWHAYDHKTKKIDEKACKYKPRPLPPLSGGAGAASASGELSVSIKITKVSDKPTEDPSSLDYDEALMHVAAVVQSGPLKGKEIGLRYWIMHEGAWTKANGKVNAGQTLKLSMLPWNKATAKDGKLREHQIFNTTGQQLTVPVFWVSKGSLAPASLLK